MNYLLQFTNEVLNETGQTIIKALKQIPNQEFNVLIEGSINQNILFPTGDLDPYAGKKLFFFQPKKVKHLVSQFNPEDTVILTDWASPLFLTTSQLRQSKFIHLITSMPPANIDVKQYKKLAPFLTVLTVSETSKQAVATISEIPETIQVITPPLLDRDTYNSQSEHNSFVVGRISPLEQNHGIETVIQAFEKNKEILPQVKLIIVGEGSEKRRLLWLIERLHLRRTIQIISAQENHDRFLPNFDIFIASHPIDQVWSPNIIKSFAYSIPVIATKTNLHSEIIEHGQTGLLYEPGNSHILSQHLLNLYNHPDWREHYISQCQHYLHNRLALNNFTKKILPFI